MDEMVVFLDKWQTLSGAILGGIFALCVALLVSYKARRQEDLSAAMLLVANLVTISTVNSILGKLAKENNIDEENLPYWYAEKLARRRIVLSPLFDVSRIRLMPIDVYIAAHLELFQVIFTGVQEKLDMLAKDYSSLDLSGKTLRDTEILKADSRLIYDGFVKAVIHAKCAERILALKVISTFRILHAMRMFIFKNDDDKECKQLLLGKS